MRSIAAEELDGKSGTRNMIEMGAERQDAEEELI